MINIDVTTIAAGLLEPLSFFTNPNKRVFWLYLLTGCLLIVVAQKFNRERSTALIKKSFKTRYWFGRNSRLDVKWIALNQLLVFMVIVPLLASQLSWAMALYRYLVDVFGRGDFIHWPYAAVVTVFTVTLFLIEDFSRFLVHYAYHKVPWLWRFHAIHHSAKVMTPLTLYRIHFVEYFLNSCRALFVTGTVSGVFIYCFDGAITVYEVLGVSIFSMLFNLCGANLRHSHVWLCFGKLERVFISPAQHQIHHSSAEPHLDKNFGASLAIWDRLFGSWLGSYNQQVDKFGLYKQANRQQLRKQLFGIR